MESTSKVRAQPSQMTIRMSDELFDAIDRYCGATGASLQNFGLRALELAVEKIGDPDHPRLLPRRKPAKSA